MKSEQDYHLEDDVTVWTRKREPIYLRESYSDERPDYVANTLGVLLFLFCVIVIVVLIYTAAYR